jgi:hypothetical protein
MVETRRSLVISLWNSNGLNFHLNELTHFLQDRRIDVALITETHFKETSFCRIPNYILYRCDHPDGTSHAGSAILVRRDISHNPLPIYQKAYLQSTSIEITASNRRLTLSSAYLPPNHSLSREQLSHFFSSLGNNFIVGGDFNCKHQQFGCRVTTVRGNVLYDTVTSKRLFYYAPTEPTYFPNDLRRLPDILDFYISSKFLPYSSVESVSDLSSDHNPVVLVISEQPLLSSPKPSLTAGFVNWINFGNRLSNLTDLNVRLSSAGEIEQAVETFTKQIQEVAWECSDGNQAPNRRMKNVPAYIRQLIVEKRRLRRMWQRNRYPRIKNELNRLTRNLKTILAQYRSDRFMAYTESLTSADKSLWQAARRALSYNLQSFSLQKPDGSWAKTNREIAEQFGQHLQDTFRPNDTDHQLHPDIHDFLETPLQLSFPPKTISPREVSCAIHSLPIGKAPGYDLITAKILRQLPRKSILFLTYVYNSILRTSHFPIQWRYSVVVLFPKPGKPHHLPSSYRPISLLSLLSKLFEKLLLPRLMEHLDSANSIPEHQFGFRNSHSTIQQCHRLVDTISLALENRQYCSGVFLDVTQAFDRVWHEGLLYKLKKVLSDGLYRIMVSYLSDRYFSVRQGDELSQLYVATAGVPQGSVLGPTLFSISVNDIPSHHDTLIATFADDIALLAIDNDPVNASQKIQQHLNLIETWTKLWKIKLSETKSQHITFTLRRQDCPTVYINNIAISHSNVVKYLGLFLDRRLTWNTHVTKTRQKLKTRFYQLKRLLDSRSRLQLSRKLTLYKTMIKPIWTYGVALWGSAKPSHTKRIQAIQNRILRTITQCPFYVSNTTLHNDMKLPLVTDTAKQLYRALHDKFQQHANPLIHNMHTLVIPGNPVRRLKRRWCRDLLG